MKRYYIILLIALLASSILIGYVVFELKEIQEQIFEPLDIKIEKNKLEFIEVNNEIMASAYTLREEECDDSPCIGAYGDNLCELMKQGIQPIASNYFPYKTKLYLEGFGEVIVLDRMNSRYGADRIDIVFKDLQEAREFGTKKLTYIDI